MTQRVFLDVECYPNYFLICFKSKTKTRFYELYEGCQLDVTSISKIMSRYLTIGFNSLVYDLPMIAYALKGATNKKLKELSDFIIKSKSKMTRWKLKEIFNISISYDWDHIDIIEVVPKVNKEDGGTSSFLIGLKTYGARMHTKVLQDLPIEPDALINKSQNEEIRTYCFNDLDITMELYSRIEETIKLREKISKIYDLDVRSKSDSQIAEAIIKKSLGITSYRSTIDPNVIYKYNVPKCINFKTDELKAFLNNIKETDFQCDANGKLIKTDTLFKHVTIHGIKFGVGIGGLHSREKHSAIIPTTDEFILDVDVISYYPTMILNNKYCPDKLGDDFLNLYEKFYNQRLEAKRQQDKVKAETYKIILNGCFGKFGSRYSILYSPSLLFHTTLTGQLSLLMLIERLLIYGFEVVSANTDGITIKGLKANSDKVNIILSKWEQATNLKLERVFYKALYQESVSSYVAITEDNKIKGKGTYGTEGLTKTPVAQICSDAVIAYLKDNKSIESTIHESRNDITKFLVARKVAGGALYRDTILGKMIRWYYSTNEDHITSRKSGNKVAMSDGAKPLMVLDGKPILDLDINRYIEKSYKMLNNLGILGCSGI